MTPKERFIARRTSGPTSQEIERQAIPWQRARRERAYNPETAIGPPPWTGPTVCLIRLQAG